VLPTLQQKIFAGEMKKNPVMVAFEKETEFGSIRNTIR
jgi:hypothetical protein